MGVGLDPGRLSVEPDEYVLREVLRIVPVAEHPQCQAEDRALIAAHEVRKGRGIARSCTRQQIDGRCLTVAGHVVSSVVPGNCIAGTGFAVPEPEVASQTIDLVEIQ